LDLKVIKQVVELMKRSELSEFEIEEEGFKLRIRRGGEDAPVSYIQAAPAGMATPPPFPVPSPEAPGEPAAPAEEEGVSTVKSPMVGTFYRAPSPEAPPFVETGAKVEAETVVCIIEAMKVMNEIQAELKGTITEILVDNGEAVEYGQPLFKVKTA
jgi:acetyl-CoA carboxylase biotin carboxyl carrier protein